MHECARDAWHVGTHDSLTYDLKNGYSDKGSCDSDFMNYDPTGTVSRLDVLLDGWGGSYMHSFELD